MHPITSYELAKAQIADLHRQARRDALARAARRARLARTRLPGISRPDTRPPPSAACLRRRPDQCVTRASRASTGIVPRTRRQPAAQEMWPKGTRDPRRPSNQWPELLASEQTGEPDHDH